MYDDDNDEGISVEVSYLENGYYKSMETYEIEETKGYYKLIIGDSILEKPEMMASTGDVIEPSVVLDTLDVQRLNVA